MAARRSRSWTSSIRARTTSTSSGAGRWSSSGRSSMAIEPLDRLLNEFIEAWNAGRRPDVDEYVERAPERERNELAGLIGAFLEIAPTPAYSSVQLEELRNDP